MPDSVITITENSMSDLIEPFTFTYSGTLRPHVGTGRLYLEGPYSLSNIRLSVGEAADQPVIVDVRKNGASIYSSPPSIPSGQVTALANSGIVQGSFSKGDYLTIDILQVGFTQTGSDLTATIRLKRLY